MEAKTINVSGTFLGMLMIIFSLCHVTGILGSLSENHIGDNKNNTTIAEPRTFGKIRRLQMALIPIMFKFGIISTLIVILVLLALKTVFLLKTLLILNMGGLLAKLLTFKYEHQNSGAGGWHQGGWSSSPNKEIHVHIHNSGGSGGNEHKTFEHIETLPPHTDISTSHYKYAGPYG